MARWATLGARYRSSDDGDDVRRLQLGSSTETKSASRQTASRQTDPITTFHRHTHSIGRPKLILSLLAKAATNSAWLLENSDSRELNYVEVDREVAKLRMLCPHKQRKLSSLWFGSNHCLFILLERVGSRFLQLASPRQLQHRFFFTWVWLLSVD